MSGFPLQPPSNGGVTSWNTRTGAVVPKSGDYTAAEVTNALDLSNTGTQTMDGSLTVDGTTTLDDTVVTNYNSPNTNFSGVAVPASGVALPTQTNAGFYCISGTVAFNVTVNGNSAFINAEDVTVYTRPGDTVAIDYNTAPGIYFQSL
jgi:hypothetical protein